MIKLPDMNQYDPSFYSNRPMRLITKLLFAVYFLMSCSGSEVETGEQAGMSLYTPGFILESRNIDQDALYPVLTIDNSVYTLTKSGSEWVGTFYLPPNDTYVVKVDWYEDYKDRELHLASQTKTIDVGVAEASAEFAVGEYDTEKFDKDGDGDSNYKERSNNTNPFLDASLEGVANVVIPRLPNSASLPEIDGSYSASEWAYANGEDSDGNTLYIRNLLLEEDSGKDMNGGEPVNRWYGIHDGNYLYLLIFADDQTQTSDSSDAWDDDNINVYLDGDYSHIHGYDGINDFHMLIPLLKLNSSQANNSDSNGARIQQGSQSKTLPQDIRFATGVGTGPAGARFTKMDVYEVRISLAQSQIEVGKLFGMDVHLDDDDSGGERDSKWGWFLQSGDTSYRFTDEFAAVVLEE